MGKSELEWISKHEKEVEKHTGEWIAIDANIGILASGETVKEIVETAEKKYSIKDPTVFKVPRKDEDMYIL